MEQTGCSKSSIAHKPNKSSKPVILKVGQVHGILYWMSRFSILQHKKLIDPKVFRNGENEGPWLFHLEAVLDFAERKLGERPEYEGKP